MANPKSEEKTDFPGRGVTLSSCPRPSLHQRKTLCLLGGEVLGEVKGPLLRDEPLALYLPQCPLSAWASWASQDQSSSSSGELGQEALGFRKVAGAWKRQEWAGACRPRAPSDGGAGWGPAPWGRSSPGVSSHGSDAVEYLLCTWHCALDATYSVGKQAFVARVVFELNLSKGRQTDSVPDQ